jgi:hypothetical protein
MLFIFKRFSRSVRSDTPSTQQKRPDHVLSQDGVISLIHADDKQGPSDPPPESEAKHLRRAWAGAVLALLFLRWSWLQSVTIRLRCKPDGQTAETDSIQANTSHVREVPGVQIPEALRYGGRFDNLSASAVLDAWLKPDSRELFDALKDAQPHAPFPEGATTVASGQDCTSPGDQVMVSLDRYAIQTILTGEHISGTEAFEAWFPRSTSQ